VAAACAAAGVRPLDLPPSSPAFSPLAAGWSKVKASLRAKAARTLEALAQAIAEALAAITSQEAHGWYDHAGYGVASKCTPLKRDQTYARDSERKGFPIMLLTRRKFCKI
jgi:hypothetical protein